jgi:hypothetical protein
MLPGRGPSESERTAPGPTSAPGAWVRSQGIRFSSLPRSQSSKLDSQLVNHRRAKEHWIPFVHGIAIVGLRRA